MNPNYALHKNPDLILTSFLAVTIIWLSGVCAAQTQLPDAAPAHLTESELVSTAKSLFVNAFFGDPARVAFNYKIVGSRPVNL